MCDGPPTVFEKLRNAQESSNSTYLTIQDVIDLRVSLGDSFNDIEKLRGAEENRNGVRFFLPDVQDIIGVFGEGFDNAERQHLREFGTQADRARYACRTAVPSE